MTLPENTLDCLIENLRSASQHSYNLKGLEYHRLSMFLSKLSRLLVLEPEKLKEITHNLPKI